MRKAKPTKRRAPPVKCPVLTIALRIGQLWDAHSMAQELEAIHKGSPFCPAEVIDQLRIATEAMANFDRAKSTPCALFQVAMATHAVGLCTINLMTKRTNGRDVQSDPMFAGFGGSISAR
jgi:hypothetical protein